jgi:hypothetical protein
MPIQQEQFKASERIDSLRSEIVSLRNEMNSQFEAVDYQFSAFRNELASLRNEMNSRFESVDERFRVFTWMQGLLLLMIAAIFSKMFFG